VLPRRVSPKERSPGRERARAEDGGDQRDNPLPREREPVVVRRPAARDDHAAGSHAHGPSLSLARIGESARRGEARKDVGRGGRERGEEGKRANLSPPSSAARPRNAPVVHKVPDHHGAHGALLRQGVGNELHRGRLCCVAGARARRRGRFCFEGKGGERRACALSVLLLVVIHSLG